MLSVIVKENSQVKEKQNVNIKGKKRIKRQLQLSISSKEDEDLMLSELVEITSGGIPVISDLCNNDSHDDMHSLDEIKLNIGDFVIVKFTGKRSVVAFIGDVERINGDEYELSFLR